MIKKNKIQFPKQSKNKFDGFYDDLITPYFKRSLNFVDLSNTKSLEYQIDSYLSNKGI